jgi:multidrug resistance efflux pump
MQYPYPAVRDDLDVISRISEGQGFRHLIRDPESEEVYEFGEKEYFIWQRLDGHTTLDSLRNSIQEIYGSNVTVEHLEAFTRKLHTWGLLKSSSAKITETRLSRSSIKVLLTGNPEGVMRWAEDGLSWCFSRSFLVILIFLTVFGLGVFVKYGGEFVYQFKAIRYLWGPGLYLLVPLLAIFVFEPLGELAKGIACKHFGGYVHASGVFLHYYCLPRFHVDISDALWLPQKSDRLKVFSAGLICRLLLWAVGILTWQLTAAWSSLQMFWLIFATASTFSFLFTAIPLIERDGYHLLSIWLSIEDLRSRAISVTKNWLLRRPRTEALSSREIRIFKWYGVLWMVFQIIFWGLLLGFAGYYFTDSLSGLGAVIFIWILMCRFGDDLKQIFTKNRIAEKMLRSHSPAFIRLRLLVRYGLIIVLIIVALLPYPFMAGGEFRLLPVKQVGIRSHVTGEVETVFVTEGQWVEKGDPIVKLTGRDQKKKVEATRAALDHAQARLELLLQGPKPEAIAAAKQEVQTAAKSLEYSTLSATRYAKLIKDNATSTQAYENALKLRDLDRERLELAKRNLALVSSGARKEEIEAVEAEVRRLQVELRHAEEDLELTILTSPIGGRIITPKLSQTIGQVLIDGDMFAVVEDARKIIAEIEVPEEDVAEVTIGASVTLRAWGYPSKAFKGKVVAIAPVAYEKSIERVERTLSEREQLYGRTRTFREEGNVVRVLSELPNEDGFLKTDMTGYAKIDSENKPVIVAFTRWLVRFIMIEVWSWIP